MTEFNQKWRSNTCQNYDIVLSFIKSNTVSFIKSNIYKNVIVPYYFSWTFVWTFFQLCDNDKIYFRLFVNHNTEGLISFCGNVQVKTYKFNFNQKVRQEVVSFKDSSREINWSCRCLTSYIVMWPVEPLEIIDRVEKLIKRALAYENLLHMQLTINKSKKKGTFSLKMRKVVSNIQKLS